MKFLFISHGLPSGFPQKVSDIVGKPNENIKVLYVTTPQNTYPKDAGWILESRRDLEKTGFNITEYDIEGKSASEVQNSITGIDIFWVSGGNTFYFLYWAEKVGLKKMLKDFLQKGGVYAGESAGVVCQIEDLKPLKWADNPKKAPEIVKSGMGLTDLIVLPHWGNEKYGRVMEKIKKYYEDRGIEVLTICDGDALLVDNKRTILLQ